MNYIQCEIVKNDKKIVTWLPDKYAKKGSFIKIKTEEDRWDNGWEVVSVYSAISTDPDSLLEVASI
jgi:hypothetical protein